MWRARWRPLPTASSTSCRPTAGGCARALPAAGVVVRTPARRSATGSAGPTWSTTNPTTRSSTPSSLAGSSPPTPRASRSPTRPSAGHGHGCVRGWTRTARASGSSAISPTTAAEWERSGHDDAELYRGGRLRTAEEWVAAATPDLTAAEQAFLDESVARRRAEEEDWPTRRPGNDGPTDACGCCSRASASCSCSRSSAAGCSWARGTGPRRRPAPRPLASWPASRAWPSSRTRSSASSWPSKRWRPRDRLGSPRCREALEQRCSEATQASRVELHSDEGAFWVDADAEGTRAVSDSPDRDVGHRLGRRDGREALGAAGSRARRSATSRSARTDGWSPSATSVQRDLGAGSGSSSSGMPRRARRCPGCRSRTASSGP